MILTASIDCRVTPPLARLADRKAGAADTRGKFVGRLKRIPAPGDAGIAQRLPDFPAIGHADCSVPNPLTLFPSANGYRRRLYEGRAVSVYYDHHPRNEWGEHCREHEQVSAFLDEAVALLRWKLTSGEWRELRIQGPTAWVIPAGTPHALTCPEQVAMVTLFMGREYTAEINGGALSEVTVSPLPLLVGRDALIGQVAKKFRRMCRDEASANAYYVESIGTMLGTHLLQALAHRAGRSERDGGLADEALLRVTRYIEQHLGESLSLAALGGVAGFSSSHFGRLFKASTGMAPHEYVMRRRVARAEEMLHDSDRKEVEIASLCGFSDETLMARWFRRILECRPSEIRAQRPR